MVKKIWCVFMPRSVVAVSWHIVIISTALLGSEEGTATNKS